MNCCTSRTYEIDSILHSDSLWIIHVRSKPRNSRSPYRRKTDACFLPPEILRMILLHLGDEVKFCGKSLLARRWSQVVPSFTKKEISSVCAARSSLCNATLVCKTWCSVATEILYGRVALLNVAQIRLFRRTLSSDPFLAKSVKKLHIGDNKAHGAKVGGFNMFGLESVVGHRIKEDIIFIIDSCGQSLHALSLDITKSLGNSPLDTSVFKHGDMALRSLRTLTLHSFNALPFIARLCMPKVEVLGLQGIDLPDSNDLPYLPTLHTLRTAMGSLNPNLLSRREFPTLRTLKTFNTDIILPEAHIGDKPGLATLENVDYLCCAKYMNVTSLANSGLLNNVQTLILATAVHVLDEKLGEWVFPELLVNLTIVSVPQWLRGGVTIESSTSPDDPRFDEFTIFKILRRCLELNSRRAVGIGSLKELKIDVTTNYPDFSLGRKRIQEEADGLFTYCSSRQVNLIFICRSWGSE